MVLTDIEKKGLRRIVEQYTLEPISKRKLKDKINNNLITNNEQLMKAIQAEEKKEAKRKEIERAEKEKERNKNELRKIVENIDLDSKSRSDLIIKIKQDKITSEIQLEEEINRKIIKNKLIEHVLNTNLTGNSKRLLKNKINNDLITNNEQLMKEIKAQEEKKSELERGKELIKRRGKQKAEQILQESSNWDNQYEEDHDYYNDLYN